jgi:GNAT superfamily N-acetyltransferase
VVRDMRMEDAATVAQLSGDLGYPTTTAQICDRFRSMAENRDAGVFVAEATDGRIVGWIHVCGMHLLESDAHAEIGGLVVAEGVRGQGMGGALLAAAEAWAERHGYDTVRVRSNVTRVEARGFYEHLGYGHIKTQNNFCKVLKAAAHGCCVTLRA